MKRINMLIGGRWVGGEEDEWLPVHDPSDGTQIAEIVNGTDAHVDEAVRAAEAAFESAEWRAWKPHERGNLLIDLARHIRENAEYFAELECRDVGKPLSQARADAEAAARYFEFYGGAADKVMGDTIPIEDGLLNATVLEPAGVTAHIVPWNYPLQIIARSVGAAIATGNAVVVKSAEDTPMTAHALTEWFAVSGLPAGIFNHVTGLGSGAGAALSAHPNINHVTFTGSVPTGIAVMQAAAKNVVPVTLELGGKSPNIVFGDADENKALDGVVRAIIQNAGQTCSAGSRLLVEERYKEEFLGKLKERFAALEVGRGMDDKDIGPILNKRQFDGIMRRIDEAKKQGKLIAGGEEVKVAGADGGHYIAPTIIDGLDHSCDIAREEIFGPVLSVFSFQTPQEAIDLANSTDYGLVAGVWTKDIDVAHTLAARIKAGQVFINNYGAGGGIQMPFGGYKKSGIGREKGFIALRNYVQVKNIAVKFGV